MRKNHQFIQPSHLTVCNRIIFKRIYIQECSNKFILWKKKLRLQKTNDKTNNLIEKNPKELKIDQTKATDSNLQNY